MSATLFPSPQQWFDSNGNPLASGKILTYIAGTSTPKTTWADYAKTIANPNPVILDGAGRAELWGDGGYKIVVTTADDVIIDTQDNIFLLGNTVDGNLTVGGTITGDSLTLTGPIIAEGPSEINGAFEVDHTSSPTVLPVKITHSNIWTNLDPYGSNSVVIESTGANNNQPILFLKKDVNTANFGNAANLILQNSGARLTTDIFAADLEMVASNTAIDTVNGKFELGVISAFGGGAGEAGGGLFYIAPRRKTADGFDRMINIYQKSRGGRIEHTGEGLSIRPQYAPGDATNVTWSNNRAFIDVVTAFTDAELNIETTLAGADTIVELSSTATGRVQMDLIGGPGTYARTIALDGSAFMYIEAQAATGDGVLEVRSNWSTPGTRSSLINLYTDAASSATGFRIVATTQQFQVRTRTAGVDTVNFSIANTADGRATFMLSSDAKQGAIQLGDGTGTEGGGRITYDSDTGIYAITGDRATFNGLRMGRRVSSAPVSSADPGEAGDFFANDSFFYVYGATGWRRVAVASF